MPNQLKNLNQPQPENQLQTMPTEESPVLGEVWDEAVNQSPKTTHTQAIWAWLKDKKTLVAAGIGFMADSYDLFVIANVMLIMSKKYALNDAYKAFITSAALAGAVFGQLFFGTLCDWFGRKAISIITVVIIVLASIASACIFEAPGASIFLFLGITRTILGIGVGGEYPLSSTMSSESSENPKTRDARVAVVFSMQGIGNTLSAVVVIICLLIFKDIEYVWRIALGFGAVPSLLAFVLRATMHETTEFQKAKAETDIWYKEIAKRTKKILSSHKRDLLGTAGTWLIFDIVFYGNALFIPTVADIVAFDKSQDEHRNLLNAAIVSLIVSLLALPGYFVAAATIHKLGRKNIQMFGFGCFAIIYILMGVFYHDLVQRPVLFFFLYGLTFFFSNFGPNTTTYVLSSCTYDANIRSTCSGISSAAGKVGAVIGASIMPVLETSRGVGDTLSIMGMIAISGLLLTHFTVPYVTQLEIGERRKKLKLPQSA